MRKAFTLIELLVVVAIIALLISILLPSLSAAREQARADVCMSNQRQLALGFIGYSGDNEDCIPGSTWDYFTPPGLPTNYENSTVMCWLGTLNGAGGDDESHVPFMGTIFPYVGQNPKIYKCPNDTVEKRVQVDTTWRGKPLYSYTAPALITGAPAALMIRTRWPKEYARAWSVEKDRTNAVEHSMPWMIVEEHERWHLTAPFDSAWSNDDSLARRHNERASVAHTDGSVSMRKYPVYPFHSAGYSPYMTANHTYYELADGRIVSGGLWGSNVKLGFLRTAPKVN